ATFVSTQTLNLFTPAAPSVTVVYITSITANWSLISGATGYTLAVSSNSGTPPNPVWDSSTTVGNGVTSASVGLGTALWPNSTYYLFVQANGPGGSGSYSTGTGTATLANLVSNGQVYAAYPTSVTVNWTALPASPSSSTAEGYVVQAATSSDFAIITASSQTAVVSLSTLTVSS